MEHSFEPGDRSLVMSIARGQPIQRTLVSNRTMQSQIVSILLGEIWASLTIIALRKATVRSREDSIRSSLCEHLCELE